MKKRLRPFHKSLGRTSLGLSSPRAGGQSLSGALLAARATALGSGPELHSADALAATGQQVQQAVVCAAEAMPPLAVRPEQVYDDGLLERCREHWRRGEWEALAQIPPEDINAHPQRERLAIMLAAAHQALGEAAQTRAYARLALQWGADGDMLARVLFAGVHNTLGRACALAGQQRDKALRHFGEAVAPGVSRSSRPRAIEARVRSQLDGLQLPQEAVKLLGSRGAGVLLPAPAVPTPLRDLNESLRRSADQMGAKFKEQVEQLWSVRKNLDAGFKRDIANAIKQIEAHASLQAYLGTGTLMPDFHGWPVSPDLACLLIQRAEQGAFDAVIEFGSGSSTVLLATALRRRSQREGRGQPIPYVVFEHLEMYWRQTGDQLRAAGFSEQDLRLLHAPLREQQAPGGDVYSYYDCEAGLQALRSALPTDRVPNLLVIVDGPPATTGPQARYPAIEWLLTALPDCSAEVILDDYARPDEKAIVQRWCSLLEQRGYRVGLQEHALEKGACSVSFTRLGGSTG